MDVARAPLKRLDLIYCQNVLIYFARERRAGLLEAFRAAWRHLGQDAAVLARGRPMAANLAAAVAHFDHAALAVTVTARARP